MKKLLVLGVLACYLLPTWAFAQITKDNLIGRWNLVDFNMQGKKGKLTTQEQNTITMMRNALKENPKFMYFVFKADGSFQAQPSTDGSDTTPTWTYSNDILTITSGKKKKSEQYKLESLNEGKLTFTALKSKVAIPILTFEKE